MNTDIKTLILKLLPWAISVVFCILMISQCQKRADIEDINNHNIKALTDSVHYFKSKLGDEVATKAILIGDIKTLRLANDSLAKRVEALVNKPENVVYIENEIIREKRDTTWLVNTPDMFKEFDFSDKWRQLAGNVALKDSALKLTIDKDIVNADLTIAIKDGRAYVSSSNPYLHVNDIQGYTLPKERKRWVHVGPSIGVGIATDGKIRPYAGLSATLSLFSW